MDNGTWPLAVFTNNAQLSLPQSAVLSHLGAILAWKLFHLSSVGQMTLSQQRDQSPSIALALELFRVSTLELVSHGFHTLLYFPSPQAV